MHENMCNWLLHIISGYKWGNIYSLKESPGVTKISDDHCIGVNHRYALTIKLHGITQGHGRV